MALDSRNVAQMLSDTYLCIIRIMKNKTLTATELARNVGDILARIRYRQESFVIERNGRPVARLVPILTAEGGTVHQALAAWADGAGNDPTFAEDLARVNAADRPAANPWAS